VEAGSERPDPAPRVEPLLLALSLLTLVTGLVDAACYLGLGRVFTANMTGNVILLAFGAAGAQGLPVLAPTVSLVVRANPSPACSITPLLFQVNSGPASGARRFIHGLVVVHPRCSGRW
jgi:hypothetical protein